MINQFFYKYILIKEYIEHLMECSKQFNIPILIINHSFFNENKAFKLKKESKKEINMIKNNNIKY